MVRGQINGGGFTVGFPLILGLFYVFIIFRRLKQEGIHSGVEP